MPRVYRWSEDVGDPQELVLGGRRQPEALVTFDVEDDDDEDDHLLFDDLLEEEDPEYVTPEEVSSQFFDPDYRIDDE
jgi:hypothetical protein